MAENRITLTVRMSTSARFTVSSATLNLSSTILEVKQLIALEAGSGNCPVNRQRLIYKGRILSDDTRTLSDYGVSGDSATLHLVKGSAQNRSGGQSGASAAPVPSPSTPFSAGVSTDSGTGLGSSGTAGSNPFLAMQQMMQQQQGSGGGMPDMNQMQQQLLQNPEMMSSIMNSPMMQSMMSNPDFMRNMMESNPQMRQVLDSNPELRHVLDDPEMMRRSMEMMRDPSAMQNMMRNQDLAMSQIENVPGGFSALRRMYEDVQEPMMDAMAGGSSQSSTSGSSTNNPNSAASGAAGAAMPNPWGSNRSTTSNAGVSQSATGTGTSATPSSGQQPMINPWASAPPSAGAGTPGQNPAGNANVANPWAMAGMGAGGQPNMNLEQTISMLENPMINQMMNQMMSDPNALQAMMDSNPMLRQMRETNPAAAAMMSNPESMRAMMNPDNLRAMMQLQQSMQQLNGSMPGFPVPPPAFGAPGVGGVTGAGSTPAQTGNGNLDFSSLLNQFQSTSLGASQPQQTTPQQRFQNQLRSLNDMGFTDEQANIRALTENHGNVNRAIEVLLMAPPTPAPAPSPAQEESGSAEPSDKKND
uniref:Ubiquilin n=1 Tax=Ditylum brightwellii TaxID=49249 RepID=A0A6U3QPU3_9STRA|mmetsp:Transcript_25385/g.36871  ORF Transcript_25385/g.36871 Transcript_25385/m.36871 type:complete len:586 (+) Transcript_25385:901-2658(+)